MKIPEEIKSKIKEFLIYVKETQNISPSNVIDKFKEMFEGQYISEYEHINEAYYEVKTQRYYIKNGCGVTLEAKSGDFDRYGSSVSHVGTDVYLFSALSKNIDFKEGISLFYSDEKEFNDDFEDIDLFLDEEIDEKIIVEIAQKTYNDGIFNIIPEKIKNNDEVAFLRYIQLQNIAEYTHREAVDYERISPYRWS